MLKAYFDESGIHDGAPICVIAGYFAGPEHWKKFEADWKTLLHHFDVPMDEFHACNIFPTARKFFSKRFKRHAEFLDAVAATIARHDQIHPIGGGIYVDDFKSFPVTERKYFTGANINNLGRLISSGNPDKPYFMPFQKCVVRLCQYASKGEKSHFAFGLDRPFAKYAVALFKQIKNTLPKNPHNQQIVLRESLGAPTFPKASETPGLQIADFLAHLTYHHFIYAGRPIDTAPPSALLAKCMTNIKAAEDFFFLDRSCLEATLQLAREISSESN